MFVLTSLFNVHTFCDNTIMIAMACDHKPIILNCINAEYLFVQASIRKYWLSLF